ncbi:MAG: ATP-binding protein [Acidobacteriota bacterium]
MFRRILLWSFGLLIFSLTAYVVTSFWLASAGQLRHDMGRRMIAFLTEEAVRSYESGGKEALAQTLARYERKFPGRQRLLDSTGRDLSSGDDLRDLLAKAEERPRFRLLPPGRFLVKRASPDGRYFLLIDAPLDFDPFSDLLSYGWIVLVVVLLSYVLAWSLAKPVRALRNTMVRFGQGDLSARYASKRRDEIGDLARSFNEMAERIETLLTAERRLLQDVSHELRSPLTRLRFALALARSGPDASVALAQIDKEINRLAGLIDELLQMTRAEGDASARNASSVDISSLLAAIVEDSRLESQARNCEIHLSVEEQLTCKGDHELLRRGVENVLRNAVHYTGPGSCVDVRGFRQDGAVVVQIRDQGPGIPENALKDIFRPFYRVDDDRNRDTGGVGLGLAIAQRAIRLHRGEIKARNMNPGLEVEIRLPIAES